MTRIDTESELNALPIGSVIRLGSGQVFVRAAVSAPMGWDWDTPGDDLRWDSASILAEHDGPHALLFVPGRDLVQEAQADAFDEALDAAYVARGIAVTNPYRQEAPRQG